MIAKIIVAILFILALIGAMYGTIKGIRQDDKTLTAIYGIASGLIGFLTGIILGSIIFQY